MPWPSLIAKNTTWPANDVYIFSGDDELITFDYTGGVQHFTITADMLPGALVVALRGGRGACGLPYNQPREDIIPLLFPWEVGVWTVMVGGDASAYQGGYGGGGDGGLSTGALFTDGGGGGGATVIWDPLGVPRAWAGGTGGAAGGVVAPADQDDFTNVFPWLAALGIDVYPPFGGDPEATGDGTVGVEVGGYGPSPLDASTFTYGAGSRQVYDGIESEAASILGVWATGCTGSIGQGGNMKYDRDPTCLGAPGSSGSGVGEADNAVGWILVHNLYHQKAVWGDSSNLYSDVPVVLGGSPAAIPAFWYGRGGNGGDLDGTGMQGPGGGGGGGGFFGGGGGGAGNFVRRFDPVDHGDDGLEFDVPVAYSDEAHPLGSFTSYWSLGPGGHGDGCNSGPDIDNPYSDGDGAASWLAGRPWHAPSTGKEDGAVISAANGRAVIVRRKYPVPPPVTTGTAVLGRIGG